MSRPHTLSRTSVTALRLDHTLLLRQPTISLFHGIAHMICRRSMLSPPTPIASTLPATFRLRVSKQETNCQSSDTPTLMIQIGLREPFLLRAHFQAVERPNHPRSILWTLFSHATKAQRTATPATPSGRESKTSTTQTTRHARYWPLTNEPPHYDASKGRRNIYAALLTAATARCCTANLAANKPEERSERRTSKATLEHRSWLFGQADSETSTSESTCLAC